MIVVTGVQGTGKSTVSHAAADVLDAPVLAHDWAMSGLRPYPALQEALDAMEPAGRGVVGWSILFALARSQLRSGKNVVLDGMARPPQVELAHQVADEELVRLLIIETRCSDIVLHRSRVEGRDRAIPNWYELNWEHVARSLDRWEPLPLTDLVLDAVTPWGENETALTNFLTRHLGEAPH
jgi:predicted kinase